MLVVAFTAPGNAEIDARAFGRIQLADEVLARPDRAATCEVAEPRRMIDRVAEHREFNARAGLESAQPFLSFVQPDIQMQFVEQFLRSFQRLLILRISCLISCAHATALKM